MALDGELHATMPAARSASRVALLVRPPSPRCRALPRREEAASQRWMSTASSKLRLRTGPRPAPGGVEAHRAVRSLSEGEKLAALAVLSRDNIEKRSAPCCLSSARLAIRLTLGRFVALHATVRGGSRPRTSRASTRRLARQARHVPPPRSQRTCRAGSCWLVHGSKMQALADDGIVSTRRRDTASGATLRRPLCHPAQLVVAEYRRRSLPDAPAQ